jgi:prephenate dehydrogenase
MRWGTLAIIGVGLIGGSIGLAARQRGLVERVLGVGRRDSSLAEAKQMGAIDEGSTDLDDAIPQADLAIFCTPVDQIAGQIQQAFSLAKQGAIFTDAGSTKNRIVAAVEEKLPEGIYFVGSHPLAGSEKKGPTHAVPHLFENRVVVVTPTEKSRPETVERVSAFWAALGARVKLMKPLEHDRALALTSHLPHLIASALAGILPDEFRELAASGFRDTTRIAASDPHLWKAIFHQNWKAILESADKFEKQLHDLRRAMVVNPDWLVELLEKGKKNREALEKLNRE